MDVTILGLDELKRNLANTPDIFNSVMKGALTQSAKKVQARAVRNAPEATGSLKGNISITNKLYSAEIKANQKYAIFVEKGTRPHFPPVDALEKWGLIKFGQPGLGFLIARKMFSLTKQ